MLKDGARRMSTFMSYYLLKIAAAEDMKAALEMLETYYGGCWSVDHYFLGGL